MGCIRVRKYNPSVKTSICKRDIEGSETYIPYTIPHAIPYEIEGAVKCKPMIKLKKVNPQIKTKKICLV